MFLRCLVETAQAILLLPYNDDAAAKRSAALLRVRQRRAERALGAEEPEAVPPPGVAGGAALSCPEPKVPKGATLEAEVT